MLKIRLRRMGKRHSPFYRVVVSDSRRTPTASAVDEVGHYDPQPSPPRLALNLDRLRYWQQQGAQLSPTVQKLMKRAESGTLEAAAEAPAAEPAKPARAKKAEKPAAEKPAAKAPEAATAEEAPKADEPTAEANAAEAPKAAAAEEANPAAEAPQAAAATAEEAAAEKPAAEEAAPEGGAEAPEKPVEG